MVAPAGRAVAAHHAGAVAGGEIVGGDASVKGLAAGQPADLAGNAAAGAERCKALVGFRAFAIAKPRRHADLGWTAIVALVVRRLAEAVQLRRDPVRVAVGFCSGRNLAGQARQPGEHARLLARQALAHLDAERFVGSDDLAGARYARPCAGENWILRRRECTACRAPRQRARARRARAMWPAAPPAADESRSARTRRQRRPGTPGGEKFRRGSAATRPFSRG